MELNIKPYSVAESISFNFEELRTALAEKTETYKHIVYTDDTIKEAKTDRATLNKLKKALSDAKRSEKENCLQPYKVFEAQINDLVTLLDAPIEIIDSTIKAAENREKEQKRKAINELWEKLNETLTVPEFLKLEKLFNERWLNKTFSMSSIEDELAGIITKVNSDLETLAALEEFCFEALDEYKRSLDINRAISEGKRITELQKRKAEALEKEKACRITPKTDDFSEVNSIDDKLIVDTSKQAEIEEKTAYLKFGCYLTRKQAAALKEFCRNNNIILERI